MVRKYDTWVAVLVLIFFQIGSVFAAEAQTRKRHVVVVVWDGMRPDFISEQNTPVLWKLASEGVVFRSHHAVYLSATVVNGVAIGTGLYPDRNGILANYVYEPAIDSAKFIDQSTPAAVRKGDEISGGKYLSAPTIAEIVQAAGGHVAIAGTKPVALLEDRHLQSVQSGVNLFAGEALPPEALPSIVSALGKFPDPKTTSYLRADDWTTQAMTKCFWKEEVPEFSLLWLSEPDAAQHEFAPGSPESLKSMKASDQNLGRVLEALDRHQERDATDIFVVSDHGFSTIQRAIDLKTILSAAGFDAVTEFAGKPRPGQIMLVGNGGSVLFYVIGHEPSITQHLVEFLEQSDFAGVIFTRTRMAGTFDFKLVKLDLPSRGYGAASAEKMPDVIMAFRWTGSKNQFGVPGMIDADWNRAAGKGTHASLSPFDMHNTLIASGPDFRHGASDDVPTGNIDVAPTILQILNMKPPQPLDGRILTEVMANDDQAPPKPETQTVQASRKFPAGTWQQTLTLSRVGSTVYIDQGNGGFRSAK